LNEIRRSFDKEQWRHCPGKLNNVDDCSRGIDAQQLLDNDRWLKGPQFLWLTEDSWPDSKIENVPYDQLEVKKEKTTLATNVIMSSTRALQELLKRYSSWRRLLKTIAWLGKFVEWLKNNKRITRNRRNWP